MQDGESRRRRIVRRLLAWYRQERRDLPWRRSRDPYAIWLSEVMLQQTRVETVLDYWTPFLRKFPSVEKLAEADVDEVLKLWEGLGYYGRARSLHACARRVVADWKGRFPRTVDELLGLPGIGPYTAGAVASIAFDRPSPAVDGNVFRVLSRLFAIEDRVDESPGKARIWELATELVPRSRPGDWTQALMELGALVCLPKGARCEPCPLRTLCLAHERGLVDELPRKGARKATPLRHEAWAVFMDEGALLMRRRADRGLLAGLWELPAVALPDPRKARKVLEKGMEELLGCPFRCGRILGKIEQVYSHFRLSVSLYPVQQGGVAQTEAEGLRWIRPDALAEITIHGAVGKALALLGFSAPPPK